MCIQARFWRYAASFLVLPCGLLLAGCGGSQGTVSGKVSYKGQPLKGGTVSIIPKAGGVVSAPIKEDGSYTISHVPPGPARVTVETRSLRPMPKRAMPGPYAKMPKDAIPEGVKVPGVTSQGDPNRYVAIPDQYADPEKSGLSLDVQRGSQPHDIDLK
jgi:hypothetical protein